MKITNCTRNLLLVIVIASGLFTIMRPQKSPYKNGKGCGSCGGG